MRLDEALCRDDVFPGAGSIVPQTDDQKVRVLRVTVHELTEAEGVLVGSPEGVDRRCTC